MRHTERGRTPAEARAISRLPFFYFFGRGAEPAADDLQRRFVDLVADDLVGQPFLEELVLGLETLDFVEFGACLHVDGPSLEVFEAELAHPLVDVRLRKAVGNRGIGLGFPLAVPQFLHDVELERPAVAVSVLHGTWDSPVSG